MRFGGVDIVLRTLALFRADERVGYHGVVSLFTEPLQGRARSTLGFERLAHHTGCKDQSFVSSGS